MASVAFEFAGDLSGMNGDDITKTKSDIEAKFVQGSGGKVARSEIKSTVLVQKGAQGRRASKLIVATITFHPSVDTAAVLKVSKQSISFQVYVLGVASVQTVLGTELSYAEVEVRIAGLPLSATSSLLLTAIAAALATGA